MHELRKVMCFENIIVLSIHRHVKAVLLIGICSPTYSTRVYGGPRVVGEESLPTASLFPILHFQVVHKS